MIFSLEILETFVAENETNKKLTHVSANQKQGMISSEQLEHEGGGRLLYKGLTVDTGDALSLKKLKSNLDDDPARVPVLTRDFKTTCVLTNDDQ